MSMSKEMTIIFNINSDGSINIKLKESSNIDEKFSLSEKVGLLELYKLNLLNTYFHTETIPENNENTN